MQAVPNCVSLPNYKTRCQSLADRSGSFESEISHGILVAQAGTAISHRLRDEPNAYNVATVDGDQLAIEVRAWSGSEFKATGVERFKQTEIGWAPV